MTQKSRSELIISVGFYLFGRMWCRCVLVVMTAFALQPPEDVLSDDSDGPPALVDADSSDDGFAGHQRNSFNVDESSESDSSDDEYARRLVERSRRYEVVLRARLQALSSPTIGAGTTHLVQPMDSGLHTGYLRAAHRAIVLQDASASLSTCVRPDNLEGRAAVLQSRSGVAAYIRAPDALGHSPTSSSSSSTSAPPHHGLARYWSTQPL